MALLFVDGFDSYSTDADLLEKWDVADATDFNFGSTTGRFGGGGLTMFDDTDSIRKHIPTSGTVITTDELFVSLSIKTEGYPGVPDSDQIMVFRSPAGNEQMSITMSPGGAIEARRGTETGTLLATSAAGVMVNAWQRVEVAAVIEDGASGKVVVTVDGVNVINSSGIDTKNDSGDEPGAAIIGFGGPDDTGPNPQWIIDDIVIHTSAGDEPTAFLGDLEIQTLRPDGTGDSSDSTAVGAATRYQAVDDVGGNDGDSTYVSMSTANDQDLYTSENLTGSPTTIHAVVLNTVSRSDGSDNRNLAALVKEGVTEGQGPTRVVPKGADYLTQQAYYPENPDTAAAWSASEVDGMQIGQKVIT